MRNHPVLPEWPRYSAELAAEPRIMQAKRTSLEAVCSRFSYQGNVRISQITEHFQPGPKRSTCAVNNSPSTRVSVGIFANQIGHTLTARPTRRSGYPTSRPSPPGMGSTWRSNRTERWSGGDWTGCRVMASKIPLPACPTWWQSQQGSSTVSL